MDSQRKRKQSRGNGMVISNLGKELRMTLVDPECEPTPDVPGKCADTPTLVRTLRWQRQLTYS